MTNQSDEIADLAAALSKCQGEMEPAIKDSTNSHFKSKYADLNAVWAACRGPLSKNGLSVVQTIDTIGDKMVLITTLFHSSGQWIKSIMPVVSARNDAQGIGSGLSYARRYSLSAICGVSQEDDDGNAAMPIEKVPSKKQKEDKPIPIPCISAEKVLTLQDQLDACDPEYAEKLRDYLEAKGVMELSQIPDPMYSKIYNGLRLNVEEYQKSLSGE
jgi:ERF superfamily